MRDLAPRASDADKQVALIAAAFYGKADMLRFLVVLGADPNTYIDSSTGFHSHATALHQAIYSGSLDAVKVLIEAGARLDLKDKIYGGTPIGWAEYMQTETEDEEMREKYKAIENYLRKL
ncbi:MAG: ankyrin repeat domain-containing protein [Bacteroidota bacterium]